MRNFTITALLLAVSSAVVFGQPCATPPGNPATYGTGNIWIGYFYDNSDLTSYHGYANEGTAASPNFDQSFGGADVYYANNGCATRTESFSVRYRLTKNFAAGSYQFIVGADDGYRLSLDGGATWIIDNWTAHAYTSTTVTTFVTGNHDMVLEFFENGGDNRVTFNVTAVCTGSENTAISPTGNIWNGYLYDGTGFQLYSGLVHEGSTTSPNFDQSYGGNTATVTSSACPVYTETFSARYRLTKNFAHGIYSFTVGGDDGYRLSTDGGATWLINRWVDQGYGTTTATATLLGTHNLVLEYYENGGANRLSFNLQTITILPIVLEKFTGRLVAEKMQLHWTISQESTPREFSIERAAESGSFSSIGIIPPQTAKQSEYSFTDNFPLSGRSSYRLKMTDENGKITYSNTIQLAQDRSAETALRVFPTILSSGNVYINSNTDLSHARLEVSDLNGRVLLQKDLGAIPAGVRFAVETAAFDRRSGFYLLAIRSPEISKPEIHKLIVP